MLEASGKAENTVVVFLSDNGGCAEKVQAGWFECHAQMRGGQEVHVGNDPSYLAGAETVYQSYGPGWANASNTPFRRFKHFAHEGGIATPLVVRWPAAITRRGAILEERGHVIDLMPTFLELAGGKYPAQFKGHAIDPEEGQSLVAALLSRLQRRGRRCSGSTKGTAPSATATGSSSPSTIGPGSFTTCNPTGPKRTISRPPAPRK